MVKETKLLLTFIVTFFTIVGCSYHSGDNKTAVENILTSETVAHIDSIDLYFNFYPERWDMTGDSLWIVNSRDSVFLTGYDIDSNKVFCSWGNIGNGPDEFLSPGLIENVHDGFLWLYGNTENRIAQYMVKDNSPIEIIHYSMPVWIGGRGLPKPYTRIAAINDSICNGTYFLPRKAGADIFNIHTSKLLDEVDLCLQQPENSMSGPYEFKVSVSGNRLVFAYRYIDRIEVHRLKNDWSSELEYFIGNDEDQYDKYEADKDEEMIKYYSDIQSDSKYAYLLYQNNEERNLQNTKTHLLKYDLDSGKNVKNILLNGYFDKLLVNDKDVVVLYSPLEENKLFLLRNP